MHGLGLNSTVWEPFVTELQRQGMSTITIDLPGHGENTNSIASIATAIKRVEAEIKNTDSETILVGHSLGGLICVEAANGAKVPVKIILVNPLLNNTQLNNLVWPAVRLTAWVRRLFNRRDNGDFSKRSDSFWKYLIYFHVLTTNKRNVLEKYLEEIRKMPSVEIADGSNAIAIIARNDELIHSSHNLKIETISAGNGHMSFRIDPHHLLDTLLKNVDR